jgi:hypothetical protein
MIQLPDNFGYCVLAIAAMSVPNMLAVRSLISFSFLFAHVMLMRSFPGFDFFLF